MDDDRRENKDDALEFKQKRSRINKVEIRFPPDDEIIDYIGIDEKSIRSEEGHPYDNLVSGSGICPIILRVRKHIVFILTLFLIFSWLSFISLEIYTLQERVEKIDISLKDGSFVIQNSASHGGGIFDVPKESNYKYGGKRPNGEAREIGDSE